MPVCAKCGHVRRVYVEDEGDLCDICQALAEGKVVISYSGQKSEFKVKSGDTKIYWKDRTPKVM